MYRTIKDGKNEKIKAMRSRLDIDLDHGLCRKIDASVLSRDQGRASVRNDRHDSDP